MCGIWPEPLESDPMIGLIPRVLASTLVAPSGCNTMAGLGKEVERLGRTIEKKAEEKI